jgi:hypothetical protein
VRGRVGAEEETRVAWNSVEISYRSRRAQTGEPRRRTRLDDLAEGGPVRRVLGDRLAKVEGLAGPVVNDKRQVVSGDAAGDGVAALLDLQMA